ncbi:hypothetical protein QCA50_005159 [Cerrena zonata]|uniref:Uncharacterized protein n=1 Tax=Cerrena zonata TaxID=2478898 RepID=A0AAW0GNE9_9APHY
MSAGSSVFVNEATTTFGNNNSFGLAAERSKRREYYVSSSSRPHLFILFSRWTIIPSFVTPGGAVLSQSSP